jgi:hypothetical protein
LKCSLYYSVIEKFIHKMSLLLIGDARVLKKPFSDFKFDATVTLTEFSVIFIQLGKNASTRLLLPQFSFTMSQIG